MRRKIKKRIPPMTATGKKKRRSSQKKPQPTTQFWKNWTKEKSDLLLMTQGMQTQQVMRETMVEIKDRGPMTIVCKRAVRRANQIARRVGTMSSTI
jgi:hypothetical protein